MAVRKALVLVAGKIAELPAADTLPQPLLLRRLTAAHANSTVTNSTVTDGTTAWTHTLVAGKSYRVKVNASYQTVALTTGARLALLGAGGLVATVAGSAWGAIAQATGATGLEASLFAHGGTTTGSFILTTAVNPINSPHNIGLEADVHCTTGGTLSVQFASEVAASAAQLNAGSCFTVEELN